MFTSARAKRLVQWGAVPTALLGSSALVWNASYSAFTAKTDNANNNWSSGTVQLSDDDSNTAMFNATNLKPGQSGEKCIAVTSTGSLPSAVKLYGTTYSQTKALGANIDVTVEEGSGASFGSCASFVPLGTGAEIFDGTLDNFATTKTSYANGSGVWQPNGSGSETRSYRITYTVKSSTPDSAQGGTAAIGFTWEAQNS